MSLPTLIIISGLIFNLSSWQLQLCGCHNVVGRFVLPPSTYQLLLVSYGLSSGYCRYALKTADEPNDEDCGTMYAMVGSKDRSTDSSEKFIDISWYYSTNLGDEVIAFTEQDYGISTAGQYYNTSKTVEFYGVAYNDSDVSAWVTIPLSGKPRYYIKDAEMN